MALSNEQWNAPSGDADFYEHQISHSLRLDRLSSSHLSLAAANTSDNEDYWTFSWWWKSSPIATDQTILSAGSGSGTSDNLLELRLRTSDDNTIRSSSTEANVFTTTAMYRDPSAWNHGCWSNNNGTSILYVNGIQVGSGSLDGGAGGSINKKNMTIGKYTLATSQYFEGYLAEMIMISHSDNAAVLTPTSFTETKNGVLIPKDVSGLSNQDFHLDFANASSLGNDVSGNDRDWTVNNISAHDQMLDSPTFGSAGSANFPTFSPLFKTQSANITEGELDFRSTGNIEGGLTSAIIPAGESTVYYFEAALTVSGGGHEVYFGVNALNIDMTGDSERGGRDEDTCWAIKLEPNQFAPVAGGTVGSNVSLTINTNDIVGMTVDRANRTIKWYINNTLKVTATDLYLTGDLAVWSGKGGGTTNIGIILNAGQDGTFIGTKTAQGNADSNNFGNFFYAPPTGSVAYCTGNLPIAEGVDPAKDVDLRTLFQALLYTGNANNSRAITTQFDPDVMWIKQRNATKAWNAYSKIQGIGSTSNYLDFSADDEIEPVSNSSNKGLLATSATSMTVGAVDYINGNTLTYVATLFNLGNTQSTNNDGNLTSTIYANAGAGMSHGSYTGEGATKTVGHGLGVVPSFIIVKKTSADANWAVYYGDNTDGLVINSGAGTVDANFWADTTPSTSVFTVGNNATTGADADYVFWAYANTEGFIKAGSYTGNGAVDGTFIYTGFKPALLIIKRKSGSESWMFMDHSRDPENVVEGVLQMNGTNGESTTDYDACDFVSNGFKMRINDVGFNFAEEYIFLAIAKNSFKYATAR